MPERIVDDEHPEAMDGRRKAKPRRANRMSRNLLKPPMVSKPPTTTL